MIFFSFAKRCEKGIEEIDILLTENKIWMSRNQNVGTLDTEQAISWGYTGPCLRSTCLNLDLRKAEPYYGYETLDFEIPGRNHRGCL